MNEDMDDKKKVLVTKTQINGKRSVKCEISFLKI